RSGPPEEVRAVRQDRPARRDLRPPRPGGPVARAAAGPHPGTRGVAAMTQRNVARLSGVTHRYGDVFAVHGIDLEIPACCMVGFIGPDGVGKSTTLALIAGSRRIQTGTVEVLGGDMAAGRHQAAICPRTRSVTTQAVRKRGRVGRELASASA